MQNIETARTQILESVNIGNLIESFKPASMQGSSIKKSLTESMNGGKLNTISALVQVVFECNNIRHIDPNAFKISEDISEKLSTDIKGSIVFCHENLSSERPNTMITNAMNVLESLVVLEEAEIKNKVRSGALNAYRNIGSIRHIIESTKLETENVVETSMHDAYVPVSYVETTNESTFIRLGKNVLALNENQVLLTKAPSNKFAFLSSIVEAMKFDQASETFQIVHEELGIFKVGKSSISRQAIGSEEIVESNVQELIDNLSMIVEAKANNAISRKKLNEQRQFVDSIVALHENYGEIAQLDNCVVVESKKNHEKFVILVHENNSFVGVLTSSRFPNTFQKCTNISEALALLEKRSGYDATKFFTHEVALLEALTEKSVSEAKALRRVIEKLEEKRDEIHGLIKEAKFEENPNESKIQLLNESKSKVEAFILEQKTNLQTYLKNNK